ncbi:MAG: outer membrane lipoprotein carrier protein LolA [Bacteroidales bacterium]
MNKIALLIIASALNLALLGQEDPEAFKALDRFASVARAAPSVSISFVMITSDVMENRTDSIEGSVVIAGDKYRLTLPENTTWFNGTDSWNYMPSVNEVVITRPENDDISFFSKPSLIFEMYKDDYRVRLVEESSSLQVIDLYPKDIRSEMIRIRMTVTRKGSELIAAEYRTRDGITITLTVKEYNLKFKPEKSYFDFNTSTYKGIEIIDMR